MRIWIAIALSGLLGLALGAWLSQRAQARRDRRTGQARNTRGKRGEELAAELLERAGYQIIERQRRSSYRVLSGGAELDVGVTFDFVVARDGRELIAEVKTGSLVTQLRHADTRRQLLEYQLISGCAQVLLVDPDSARITEVSFPLGIGPETPSSSQHERSAAFWLWGALLVAAGLLYVWAHRH